ncbi:MULTISPECIES: isochorismatase family protein [Bradyrhizobium]|uniref:Nicotinamidase-related amidase n=1 Tax=Bradyrhizobium elkanii TaxID=29448 RepID=A0A8I1Y4H2_BRAEL|nr:MULTISPECIES: isochorismatase family protein [Bradyrhizobium]MBP1291839.1 nicotinamidase-related amidase [Bradyrhizobium elkanii]MCP1927849.1 nicotinamidase-related amidase [Bradyrhizobium elkanii]MCS3474762.1 nicotinamidase-related amidase [Bradyrhizobium elkanii]MCS3581542.1 nicotinamidase-related amidase [Bradyrhizobium elkanii]MCS3724416.1 nicotinamidase-related amidase [Bradyrhizobium elkanii]
MALTTLDPITALIVIDLQSGLMGWPFAHPIGDIVARAAALGAAFRRRGLPVALVNVDGSSPGRTEQAPRQGNPNGNPIGNPFGGPLPEGWTDLIPELDRQPSDIVVTKRTRGAFASTDLESLLRARGVTQVVIAGVATAGGVESTARQAYEAGFNVTLAIDAMTDARPHAHAYSIEHVFPRLGETGSTQAIIDLVERTDAHELA